jgi:hypothetical protein
MYAASELLMTNYGLKGLPPTPPPAVRAHAPPPPPPRPHNTPPPAAHAAPSAPVTIDMPDKASISSWYVASDFDQATQTWPDKATRAVATTTHALAVNNTAETHGSGASFAAVMGPNTTSAILFPLRLGTAYTVCVVQRPVGQLSGPLLVGNGGWWFLGTYAGIPGPTYAGGSYWASKGSTAALYSPGTNWASICMSCSGAATASTAQYYVNGTDQTNPGASCANPVGQLAFNLASFGPQNFGYYDNKSPFAVAEVITWSVALPETNLATVARYYARKYGVVGGAPSEPPPVAPAAPRNLVSLVYPRGVHEAPYVT